MLKKINELKREKAIKKITGNLGFVIEKEDKLICYVQKEKFYFYDGFAVDSYVIRIEDYKKNNSDLVEKYGLDKEIIYVFDGLTFDKKEPVIINIFDNASRLEIKNCRFDCGVVINYPKECIIKNTVINTDYLSYQCEIKARDLILDNVDINNNDNMPLFNKVTIYAKDSIKIRNSIIKADKCIIGDIITKKICIENSTIEAKSNIDINALKLISKNSKAISNHIIKLFVKFYDKVCGLLLNSSYIYVNDVRLCREDNGISIYLRPLNDLDKQRKVLINHLKELKDNFEFKRDETLKMVKGNYNSQSVGKILLRGKDR